MVQVGSQKYTRIFLKLFSYLSSSQNWLNLDVDHHHYGYNKKLSKKNIAIDRLSTFFLIPKINS